MIKRLIAILILLLAAGCSGPEINLVSREEPGINGVRVSKILPYDIYIYSTDSNGQLHLHQHLFEYLPHPTNVYVINYEGAFIYSSTLEVELHEHTGLKKVHLETSRTMKEGAEAAKELYKEYPREEEPEPEPEKEMITILGEIKAYREAYGTATSLPPAPGEPNLPDGSSLPSNP